MGRIEDLQQAFARLSSLMNASYAYYESSGNIVIRAGSKKGDRWSLLFCSEGGRPFNAYFYIIVWSRLTGPHGQNFSDNEQVIFSARTVMKAVGFDYVPKNDGLLEDLDDLCRVIKKNYPKISEALSPENLQETLSDLYSLEDESDEEKNRIKNLNRSLFYT